MSAATRVVPPTTNLLQYVAFLEASNEYHSHQLDRAREEIRNLKLDLARAKGENLRALGVAR